MSTEQSSPPVPRLSVADRLRRATNRFSIVLSTVMLLVLGLGAVALPADARAYIEDSSGTLVASYSPSAVEAAAYGVATLAGGGTSAQVMPPASTIPEDDLSVEAMCASMDRYQSFYQGNLPIYRWADATSPMHTRYGRNLFENIAGALGTRLVTDNAIAVGNAFWNASVTMTEAASKFCIAEETGRAIDRSMARAAEALFFNSGIGVALFVFAAAAAIYAGVRRGGGPQWGKLFRIFMVGAIFTVMMLGAQDTDDTSYGRWSPGWILNEVNRTISHTSGYLSSAMVDFAISDDQETTGPNDHCSKYIAQLHNRYDEINREANQAGVTAAVRSLNAVWETSGLDAYTQAQFGRDQIYGPDVNCHLLEYNSQERPREHANMWTQAVGLSFLNDTEVSTQLWTPQTNEQIDQNMVFWAACDFNGTSNAHLASDAHWSVAPGWAGITNANTKWSESYRWSDGEHLQTGMCSEAFLNPDFDWDGSWFNFKGKDYIDDGLENGTDLGNVNAQPGVFINTFQGHAASNGMVPSILYAVVGFLLMLLFGALALVLLIAKLAVLPMLILVFFVAMFDLVTGRPGSRLLTFAKTMLGLVFVAWLAGFLIAVIAAVTHIIHSLGSGLGMGSTGTIVWSGLAPIMAIALLKFLFSKVLKMPDPLSINGAKSMMGGAADMGGAAMARAGSFASNMGRGAMGALTGSSRTGADGGDGAGRGGTGPFTGDDATGSQSAGRGRRNAMTADDPRPGLEQGQGATDDQSGTKAGALEGGDRTGGATAEVEGAQTAGALPGAAGALPSGSGDAEKSAAGAGRGGRGRAASTQDEANTGGERTGGLVPVGAAGAAAGAATAGGGRGADTDADGAEGRAARGADADRDRFDSAGYAKIGNDEEGTRSGGFSAAGRGFAAKARAGARSMRRGVGGGGARRPKTRFDAAGQALPDNVRKTWMKERGLSGSDSLSTADMVRRGKAIEREAFGGKGAVRRAHAQMERHRRKAHYESMGRVGGMTQHAKDASRNLARGATSGKAAVALGAAGVATSMAVGTLAAPALLAAGAGAATIAVMRKRNEAKAGTGAARRAQERRHYLSVFNEDAEKKRREADAAKRADGRADAGAAVSSSDDKSGAQRSASGSEPAGETTGQTGGVDSRSVDETGSAQGEESQSEDEQASGVDIPTGPERTGGIDSQDEATAAEGSDDEVPQASSEGSDVQPTSSATGAEDGEVPQPSEGGEQTSGVDVPGGPQRTGGIDTDDDDSEAEGTDTDGTGIEGEDPAVGASADVEAGDAPHPSGESGEQAAGVATPTGTERTGGIDAGSGQSGGEGADASGGDAFGTGSGGYGPTGDALVDGEAPDAPSEGGEASGLDTPLGPGRVGGIETDSDQAGSEQASDDGAEVSGSDVTGDGAGGYNLDGDAIDTSGEAPDAPSEGEEASGLDTPLGADRTEGMSGAGEDQPSDEPPSDEPPSEEPGGGGVEPGGGGSGDQPGDGSGGYDTSGDAPDAPMDGSDEQADGLDTPLESGRTEGMSGSGDYDGGSSGDAPDAPIEGEQASGLDQPVDSGRSEGMDGGGSDSGGQPAESGSGVGQDRPAEGSTGDGSGSGYTGSDGDAAPTGDERQEVRERASGLDQPVEASRSEGMSGSAGFSTSDSGQQPERAEYQRQPEQVERTEQQVEQPQREPGRVEQSSERQSERTDYRQAPSDQARTAGMGGAGGEVRASDSGTSRDEGRSAGRSADATGGASTYQGQQAPADGDTSGDWSAAGGDAPSIPEEVSSAGVQGGPGRHRAFDADAPRPDTVHEQGSEYSPAPGHDVSPGSWSATPTGHVPDQGRQDASSSGERSVEPVESAGQEQDAPAPPDVEPGAGRQGGMG